MDQVHWYIQRHILVQNKVKFHFDEQYSHIYLYIHMSIYFTSVKITSIIMK